MKLKILLILLFFNGTSSLFAQETAKPLIDSEIMRNVSRMDIEGKLYENVKVTLKSISPDYFFSDKYKVKITIVNMENMIIWKKTLKNVYLYVFSSGQTEVAQSNFIKILIHKNDSGSFIGTIREKEGIY